MLTNIENEKQLIQQVRDLERKNFPEFADTTEYVDSESKYIYFSPSYLLGRGLLDINGLLNMLYDNRSLLSIGSGKAYFEQMLVLLGAKKDHITLSDIDETVLPDEYTSVAFDMTGQWPNFSQKFDYIVFPESMLGVSQKFEDRKNEQYLNALVQCLRNALNSLKPGGEIRAVSWFFPSEREYIKKHFANDEVDIQADTFELLVIKSKKTGEKK